MTLKGRQDENIRQDLADRFDPYCGLKYRCSAMVAFWSPKSAMGVQIPPPVLIRPFSSVWSERLAHNEKVTGSNPV